MPTDSSPSRPSSRSSEPAESAARSARLKLGPAAGYAVRLALVTLAYFVSAKIGLEFAFAQSSVTAVWPPTGVAIAAVLIWGPRMAPAVALGAFLANVTTEAPLGAVLGITVGNTLEALTAGFLLARVDFRRSLERIKDVLLYVGLAAVASTTVSAAVGTLSLLAAGAIDAGDLAVTWRVWWLGDMTGALLVGAVLLVVASRPGWQHGRWRALEAALATAVLAGVCVLVFSGDQSLTYILFPPLLWAALRFHRCGAVMGSLLLAGIGVWFTSRGYGPFADGSPDATLLRSQTFAAAAAVTALLIASGRTERESAERALLSSEVEREKFQRLLDAGPDAMVIVDAQGEIVLVNDQTEKLFGYSRAELLGQRVELLIPARVRTKHRRLRDGYSQAPAARPMGEGSELNARHRDGHEFPVEISLSPLEIGDERFVSSAIRDISARKRAEREQLRSAARMAEAQQVARFGNWEWSVATDTVEWSDELFRIFGLEASKQDVSFDDYLERVHPADRDEVQAKIGGALENGETFRFEHQVVRPDGAVRLVRCQGRPIPEQQGEGERLVGVCQDITELGEAEAAVQEAQARFRSAFENAPIGIALVDAQPTRVHRLLDANHALGELTGYSREELLAQTLHGVTHPDDVASVDDELRQLLAGTRDAHSVEKRIVHAGGEAIWVQINASLVRNAAGKPAYAIVQFQDIGERKRFEDRLQRLADHDSLTGLVNRRRFRRELDHAVAHKARYGGQGAVLVIDLDRFKYVNDTAGHGVGDQLIRQVGAVLRGRLRESDVVARLGGDEFAVLMPEGRREDALGVARELRAQIHREAVVISGSRPVSLTASVGVSLFSGEPGETGEGVLVNADLAMYQAKQHGRDRVEQLEAPEVPRTRMRKQVVLSEQVREALHDDAFVLHAQPIYDLEHERVARHELLLRMLGDDGRLIPPAAFIPVAEEFGLMAAIDSWVIRQAIGLIARAPGELRLAVNVSGASMGDETVLALIEKPFATGAIDPASLVFEVTETAAIVNIEQANRFATRLNELGCAFALDDFGAGFGSFYYLKHVPFEYLKIDGEFIQNMPDSRTDQLTVRAIAEMAHGLGKWTVAEFVEDERTLELLREYGVDYAQGYHLGRPRPVKDGFAASAARVSRRPGHLLTIGPEP